MSNFFNDCVSEEDYLDYNPYISAFTYLISNHNSLMTPPIVFGIHGKWGTGKSTFMHLLKNNLDRTNKFFTLEINPWEYGNNENFLNIFIAKLYNQVKSKTKEIGVDSFKEFMMAVAKPLKLSINVKAVKAEFDFSKLSLQSQKDIIESFVSENFQIKELITDILDKKIFKEKKVIVFIDDLDRCLEEKVMEVIESIKLVLNSENCIFFLACDLNYIERALSVKYSDFIEKNDNIKSEVLEKNFAREYLEKIIQIPFSVPSITNDTIRKFVDNILKNNETKNTNVIINDDIYNDFIADLDKELLTDMIIEAKLNPRRIKRTLNLIFLNYIFMKFKPQVQSINIDLLCILSMIKETNPEYYKKNIANEFYCTNVFNMFFKYYNLNSGFNDENTDTENDINQESIYKYFKILFKYANIDDLHKAIKDLKIYISFTNTTTAENYSEMDWGIIGEIKSDTHTGRKLKVFLRRLNDDISNEFMFWFFHDVFLKNINIYGIGIQQNIHIYLKNKSGNFDPEKDLIFRIEYDENKKEIRICFHWRAKFNTIIDNIENIISTKYYNKSNKVITISQLINVEEFEIVKKDITNLMNSVKCKNGIVKEKEIEKLALSELE